MKYEQFNPAFRVPEIILYEHANFEGREFRTNLLFVGDVGALTHITFPSGVYTQVFIQQNYAQAGSNLLYKTWNMNDKISSIVIVSGIWQFYRNINLNQELGPPLKPGYYPFVENIGIQNDHISSFECIEQTIL